MLDRLARTLSGGMLRRLEIATALLNRPAVLFLDEPTVGLDPTARRMVWERLDALVAQAHTTIVVTTHLMEEAEQHCDRLAVIDHGRLVEQGEPGELLERHATESLEEVFIAVTGRAIDDDAPRRARKGGCRMSAPSAASPAVSANPRPARPVGVAAGACGRRHARDGPGRDAQAAPRPPGHHHAIGPAAAVAVHLRHRGRERAPDPRSRRQLPRLPSPWRARPGGDVHRDLLRPGRHLGTRRRAAAAPVGHPSAPLGDRARQG